MHSIFHDLQINSTPDQIFDCISNPKELVNWWPLRCSGKAAVDENYNLFFTEEYNWFGKVSRIKTNHSFYIKMTKADQDWDPTTFGFTLQENEAGVLVEFSHTNWPENNHHFRRSSYCWALLLEGLKNYVEKGLIIPFDSRG